MRKFTVPVVVPTFPRSTAAVKSATDSVRDRLHRKPNNNTITLDISNFDAKTLARLEKLVGKNNAVETTSV